MTQPSPDARAVVRALDALTTQVRRLADGTATPVVAPSGYHPTGVRPEPTTAPDTPSPLAADRAADDEQTLRWARRESLLVLLTRLQRGRHLTEDEARTLRHHVETEMREADTAREVARGNLRHVREIVPELDRLTAELEDAEQRADGFRTERDRLGHEVVNWADLARHHQRWGQRRWNAWLSARGRAQRKQAAIERVRAYLASQTAAFPKGYVVAVAAADVLAALDGTEQPTTKD